MSTHNNQQADVAVAVRPISAALARRLAEAADGFRDGNEHWFVFKYAKRSHLDAHHVAERKARDYYAALPEPAEFGVFGPYMTPASRTRRANVTRVCVEIGGETRDFPPDRFDSLFWTESALDKFLIPYYTHVDGIETARALREELLTYDVVGHPPESWPRKADEPFALIAVGMRDGILHQIGLEAGRVSASPIQ